jgi:hypothetical protein
VTPAQESKNCDERQKKKTKAHAFPEFGETENKNRATETETETLREMGVSSIGTECAYVISRQ